MGRRRTISISNKQQLSENLFYVIVWAAIFLVPILNVELTSREHLYAEDVLMSWIKIAPYALVFLLHNIIVAPRALRSKNYGRYLFALVALLLSIFGAVNFTQRYVIPSLDFIKSMGLEHMTLTDINILSNLAFSLVMCSGNMGIKLIYKSMRDDQLMEELKLQNLRVEMEYLKYQINPHFFMNTLNNIHALIDIDTTTAKSAVIELSKMMRYVLYDSGNESISLNAELQFVKNYIELMKIRYDDMIKVSFHAPEIIPTNYTTPPLLMIVFIENAFKHGIKAVGDSFVNIDICIDNDDMISITVVNSISNIRQTVGGIGLTNVRKRLELLYEDRFVLINEQREDNYFINLKIPKKDA